MSSHDLVFGNLRKFSETYDDLGAARIVCVLTINTRNLTYVRPMPNIGLVFT